MHWKKIIPNFYTFRPLAKLKILWTDAHTALGTIGLSFQFVYAVTGAYFLLRTVIIIPTVPLLYNGNLAELSKDVGRGSVSFPLKYEKAKHISLNTLMENTTNKWEGFKLTRVNLINYGDLNMKVEVIGKTDYKHKFTGIGKALYNGITGNVISKKDPYKETTYTDGVRNVIARLHFGDYGCPLLKITSVVLGFISCFVIISGVMIWLVARDKKNIPEYKKKFNRILVRLYLAVCLSMYPVTAFIFILVKVNGASGKGFLYPWYFLSWLALSTFFMWKKDNSFITKWSFLSGSILGFLIPVVNGIYSGNWFWRAFTLGKFDTITVDVFWIALSFTGFFIYYRMTNRSIKS